MFYLGGGGHILDVFSFFFSKDRLLDLHMSKREREKKKKKAYKGQQDLMMKGSRSANIGTCRLSLGGAGMCKC